MTDISVPREDLQALLDTAIGSMDFGSGFLDHEEVDCLRRIAVLLGVDPADATPDEFQSTYPHPFDAQDRRVYEGPYNPRLAVGGDRPWHIEVVCRRCQKPRENEMHSTVGSKS